MSSALLAAVVVYFTGHMIVAVPRDEASPKLPTIALVPADPLHEPVLLIRSMDLVKFRSERSGLTLRSTYLADGTPALEIPLSGWDVMVGSTDYPDYAFSVAKSYEALSAWKLDASAEEEMVALSATTDERSPRGVSGRLILKHSGRLETFEPLDDGAKHNTWTCSPVSAECEYNNTQKLTDRLEWTSGGEAPVITLRPHSGGIAPALQLSSDAKIWFMSRVVVRSWPPPTGSGVPHVPMYGHSLAYGKPLPTISIPGKNVKPVFCPPIMAWREE